MKFKVGETIYYVYAFPESGKSWIDKVTVIVASATMEFVDVPSIIVRKYDNTYTNEISLRDANVIPNNYNSHRIFKTELEANAYANDPDNWRPLGFTAEEWNDYAKDDYILDNTNMRFCDE